MTTFRMASRGVSWMLGTQIFIGIGQFLYSGVTARAFTPAEFGSYSAAMAPVGILILLTTTGLPSVVLRESLLTRADVTWIRTYALIGGAVTAIVYVFIAPFWVRLLGAPDGTQFFLLLALSLLIGPIAAVESSLLRRESKTGADAASLLLTFLLPAAVAIVATLVIRQAWALALVPVFAALTLGIASASLRRHKYVQPGLSRHSELLGFSWKVSAQNILFLVIYQSQAWVLSATLGAGALGQYSRATTLSNTPAAAFTTALNRAVQPHWRKLKGIESTAGAIRDTALLTSSLTFPAFSILAVIGAPFTYVWLGPGWGDAAKAIPWLAIASGLGIPFGILATSLEMRNHFAVVRIGQIGLALGVVVGLTMFITTRDISSAAAGVMVSQLLGLVALLCGMAKSSHMSIRGLLWAVALPALWSVGVALTGFIGVQVSDFLDWKAFGSANLMAVVVGSVAGTAFWLSTFRWQPASQALQARGVRLPRGLSPRQSER